MSDSVPVPGSSTATTTDPVEKTTCQYGVVKKILEYLPFQDLNSASNVCRLWMEIGNIVRSQRPFGPVFIPVHRFPEDRLKTLILHGNRVDLDLDADLWIRENLRYNRAEAQSLLQFLPPFMHSTFEQIKYLIDPEQLILIATPVTANFIPDWCKHLFRGFIVYCSFII